MRGELDELFRFINEFGEKEELELRLVLFVDDLDRCLEGRNVKVLEAIQLDLAIPAAPITVILAIDARVVVASIEATVNKSLSIHDALISGWEYMEDCSAPFLCSRASTREIEASREVICVLSS